MSENGALFLRDRVMMHPLSILRNYERRNFNKNGKKAFLPLDILDKYLPKSRFRDKGKYT